MRYEGRPYTTQHSVLNCKGAVLFVNIESVRQISEMEN